jgi:hypothetical protein
LRKTLGVAASDSIVTIAEGVSALSEPEPEPWLVRLAGIVAIDPGEAQIFASAAAEQESFVITGDKRALRALKDVEDFSAALEGRIAVMEAILIAVCDRIGPEEVRGRLRPVLALDGMIEICFANAGSDPKDGLRSYFDSLAAEVRPLVLWNPPGTCS